MNTKDEVETEAPETLYEQFMSAADQFDAAEADDTRQQWMDTAVALYQKMVDLLDHLTESQQKRIKRTISYLDEVAAEAKPE